MDDTTHISNLQEEIERLESQLASMRSKLSTAERGWKREYEWRRTMENFIRDNCVVYMSVNECGEFHNRLTKRIPLKPRKKFGRR